MTSPPKKELFSGQGQKPISWCAAQHISMHRAISERERLSDFYGPRIMTQPLSLASTMSNEGQKSLASWICSKDAYRTVAMRGNHVGREAGGGSKDVPLKNLPRVSKGWARKYTSPLIHPRHRHGTGYQINKNSILIIDIKTTTVWKRWIRSSCQEWVLARVSPLF